MFGYCLWKPSASSLNVFCWLASSPPPRQQNHVSVTGPLGEYVAGANKLVTCCIQVETTDALRDLEQLLAVPGVDCVLIGPNDLAASLGHRGDLAHPEVEAAIMRTLEVGRQAGVPIGVWTGSPDQARTRREQGFAFGTLGTDYGFMAAAAEAAVAGVRGTD